MNKETKEIIHLIAEIQKESLQSILKTDLEHPEELDYGLLRKLLNITGTEVRCHVDSLYRLYDSISKIPSSIQMVLNEYQLLVCTHILFKMEDEWIIDNAAGVMGAWDVLNKSLERYHPEFKLII